MVVEAFPAILSAINSIYDGAIVPTPEIMAFSGKLQDIEDKYAELEGDL